MSLITANPSPYALIPHPYAPRCRPPSVDPGEHPAELGLAVGERRRLPVHRQGQRRPLGPGQIVGQYECGLGLLVQPVVTQRVVQLRGAGTGQQARAGQPGRGRDRGGLQYPRTVSAALHRTRTDRHDDREAVLTGPRLPPGGRLVAMPDRAVLNGTVGAHTDLHQPARAGECLVKSVPRKGCAQIAVDRTHPQPTRRPHVRAPPRSSVPEAAHPNGRPHCRTEGEYSGGVGVERRTLVSIDLRTLLQQVGGSS